LILRGQSWGKTRAQPRDVVGVKSHKHRRASARGQSIPASLQVILDSFAGCFTAPSFENFVALISGWILCQGRHCISRVIQVAGGTGGAKHFATLYRFLSRARWSVDELGRVLFGALLRVLPNDIDAMVDDTLCRHRGRRIFGAGMHHDAALSTYGHGTGSGRVTGFSCGHCWVVLAVRVPLPWDRERGIAIPILFRLYRSKKHCDARCYRKRTELARELVALLESWIPPGYRLFLSGDAEYASRTLVRELGADTAFVGPMVMDAALYEPAGDYGGTGRPRKKGKRLHSPQQMAARASRWRKITICAYGRRITVKVKERVCLWYTVAGVRLVRVVVTRDPKGRSMDRAYFSTDAEMSAEEILARFTRRWLIEVSFRDVKQWLGAEDPQNGWSRGKRRGRKKPGPQARGDRGKHAVMHTVPLAFIAYAVVVLWYLREGAPKRDVDRTRKRAPWYRHKSTPAFGDMLVALRREAWATRLSEHPGKKGVLAKLRRLLPDALLAA
jgi:hypothetical protein